ncbi:esterase/lipase family protein [Sinorhizobium fredii]|uniref:esterase/lipase family protein n=1 Tax=Rhizobium fredii TaxID=380 RepID=UPI001FCB3147|nr:hypothetical protein [Sinorhizobium fredii]
MFVHGLTGHYEKTWHSRSSPPEFWPYWLEDDLPNVAVWSLGYPAEASRWQSGGAMALPDRARNLLPLLANEPKLTKGNIIFVGHSLGGLIIKQLLQLAASEGAHQRDRAHFLRRVRKVAFVGTPHFGSDQGTLANKLRLLFRPRETIAGLSRNDPHLASLNSWFRNYSVEHSIDCIVFQEHRPVRWLGKIVKNDSSDPGLAPSAPVIPLDEDHISIVKPADRNADIYRHILNFVSKPPTGAHTDTLVTEKIEQLGEVIGENTNATKLVAKALQNATDGARFVGSNAILDEAADARLLVLKQGRFFGDFDTMGEARRLCRDLLTGQLIHASNSTRAKALSWCARILTSSAPKDEVETIVGEAEKLATVPEVVVARAFISATAGDKPNALSEANSIGSPLGRSAAFIIAARETDAEAALRWMNAAGISVHDMDSDGKLVAISKYLEAGHWTDALAVVGGLTHDDYQNTPALLRTAATTHLVQAIPQELRSHVLMFPPFHSGSFPLATDSVALSYRRTAQGLFERTSEVSERMGCVESGRAADDMALWLALRDPAHGQEARGRLIAKLKTPGEALHFVHTAVEFGVPIEVSEVRREIERQDALTGGKSRDAILAGLTLALMTGDAREIANYIDANRARLAELIDSEWLDGQRVRALALSDQTSEAERLLAMMVAGGLASASAASLQRSIDEAKGADSTSLREEQYEQTGTIDDLANLVGHLELKSDWERLVGRAAELFERTHDLAAARLYVRALSETDRDKQLVSFFDNNPDLIDQSQQFRPAFAWALFRIGKLKRASELLLELRSRRDDTNTRTLFVSLAIASGDWEALVPFVETEWEQRANRTAQELLKAGQLGIHFGLPRAKDLIFEAAARANDDPTVLIACYGAAVKGNWENDPAIHGWLREAADLSDASGPVQAISFEELVERQPAWEERESTTWDHYQAGDLPMFAVGRLLNRTLTDLLLLPALTNLRESDVRRRSLICAFSGARGAALCDATSLAVDPNALLTLSFLGILEKALNSYQNIVVPHSTMGWLFEETQRVEFHQPSKVTEARKLKQLLADGRLERFETSTPVDITLVQEVGENLAALLAAASLHDPNDRRQRIVVRPYPVHRVGSLMRETTDLPDYAQYLCGCGDVVAALRQAGQLTATEEERARTYLSLQERPWPHAVTIEPNAILYLDDLALTYLQHLDIIDKLKTAGFTANVSAQEVDEADALIRYDASASDALTILTKLRREVAAGIANGKIELGEIANDEFHPESSNHPTAAVLALASHAEAVLVDDRYVNQHANINSSNKLVPVITTLDLLDVLSSKGVLSVAERLECTTTLRRSGFCMISITRQELRDALQAAQINDKAIRETAELRSMRESVLRLQMTSALQLPKERAWLEAISQASLEVLWEQWEPDVADSVARAKSDWLWSLIDARHWAHRATTTADPDAIQLPFRAQLWALIGARVNSAHDVRQRYLAWLDESVFAEIKEADAETYRWLVEEVREVIDQASQASLESEGSDGDY